MTAPARGGRSGERKAVLADGCEHTPKRRKYKHRGTHGNSAIPRRMPTRHCIGCHRVVHRRQWYAVMLRDPLTLIIVSAEDQEALRYVGLLCARCEHDVRVYPFWESEILCRLAFYPERRVPRKASQ